MPPSLRRISAGIPAYNTGPRLREAVRSLLTQTLPPGFEWSSLYIVVSGCTDDTPSIADALARADPRVIVVRQIGREGKASALRAVFERADGEGLVLLNGDATAEPGSVASLLGAAAGAPPPFAIMGRPCLPKGTSGGFRRGIEVLWELHHRLHEATLGGPLGNHLSDELWLLSLPILPALPHGVVNDGAYVGAWLRGHGGQVRYSPEARVTIEVPRTAAEHLRQRRRIAWGNGQVRELLGVAPVTWVEWAMLDPPTAFRILVQILRTRPVVLPWTLFLVVLEVEAMFLAKWDRHVTGRNHVLWEVVPPDRTGPSPGGPLEGPAEGDPRWIHRWGPSEGRPTPQREEPGARPRSQRYLEEG
ncbi:MAG TPA: glycosyltransferase family 2 protein [Thermoplasmata archaeon]|nr:glycosyltransferase family 2 protein [Thermoplasmata archaeon]